MSESRPEHNIEVHRRIIEGSLRKLYDDLKEHLVHLTPEDYDSLAKGFGSEVNDYVGDLLRRIEKKRAERREKR